jgi:hypothetical protein
MTDRRACFSLSVIRLATWTAQEHRPTKAEDVGKPAKFQTSFAAECTRILRRIIQGRNYFVNIVANYFDPNYCVYFVVNCFETGIVHEQSSRCSYPR